MVFSPTLFDFIHPVLYCQASLPEAQTAYLFEVSQLLPFPVEPTLSILPWSLGPSTLLNELTFLHELWNFFSPIKSSCTQFFHRPYMSPVSTSLSLLCSPLKFHLSWANLKYRCKNVTSSMSPSGSCLFSTLSLSHTGTLLPTFVLLMSSLPYWIINSGGKGQTPNLCMLIELCIMPQLRQMFNKSSLNWIKI